MHSVYAVPDPDLEIRGGGGGGESWRVLKSWYTGWEPEKMISALFRRQT